MTFDEYQDKSRKTALYPNLGLQHPFTYVVLGLVGEAGEIAEKIKKVLRDKGGVVDDATKGELKKELGDVLWYIAQLATEFGLSLDEVAAQNIEKLYSRMERGVLHGSGDNR